MKERHGWNTFENYLRVHESVLKKYSSHIVSQNPKYVLVKFRDHYCQLKLEKLEIQTLTHTSTLTFKKTSKFSLELEDRLHVLKDSLIKLGSREMEGILSDTAVNMTRITSFITSMTIPKFLLKS